VEKHRSTKSMHRTLFAKTVSPLGAVTRNPPVVRAWWYLMVHTPHRFKNSPSAIAPAIATAVLATRAGVPRKYKIVPLWVRGPLITIRYSGGYSGYSAVTHPKSIEILKCLNIKYQVRKQTPLQPPHRLVEDFFALLVNMCRYIC